LISKNRIIFSCPVASNGGVETHILNLLRIFNSKDVIIITRYFSANTNLAEFCHLNSIKIIFLSKNSFFRIIQVLRLKLNILYFNVIFYSVDTSRFSRFISRIIANKTILNPVGNPMDVAKQLNGRLAKFKNPIVIVESEGHRQLLENQCIEVIPHLSNVEAYSPVNTRSKKIIVFGFLNWLNENKQPLEVLEVFLEVSQKYDNARMLLRNDGPLFPLVFEFIQRNNLELKVEFISAWHSIHELREIYKRIDCSILFSKSEGLPLTLIESISFGVPFISTNVGSVNELIEFSPNSMLIANSKTSLAFAIEKQINENQSIEILPNQKLKFEQKFTKQYLINKYKKIILD
jgi:glycosyltransferase involved in cell wall biosynthesis